MGGWMAGNHTNNDATTCFSSPPPPHPARASRGATLSSLVVLRLARESTARAWVGGNHTHTDATISRAMNRGPAVAS